MSARAPWPSLGIALVSSAVTAGVMYLYWPGQPPDEPPGGRQAAEDARTAERWPLAPTRVSEELQPVASAGWQPQPVTIDDETFSRSGLPVAAGQGSKPSTAGTRLPQLEAALQPLLFKSPDAWRGHPSGTVRLRAQVSKTGLVKSVELLRGGPSYLARRSAAALRGVRFGPARNQGVTVAVQRDFEITLNPEQRRVEVLWLGSTIIPDVSTRITRSRNATPTRTDSAKAKGASVRRSRKPTKPRARSESGAATPESPRLAPGFAVLPADGSAESPTRSTTAVDETLTEAPDDCRRVFVTRETYRGDFRLPDAPPGDLSAVDAHCRRAAEAGGLETKSRWTAWLSTRTRAASERIEGDGPWCVAANGTSADEGQPADGHVGQPTAEKLAFENRAQLAEEPAVALDRDQFGKPLFYALYWTGNEEDGQPGEDDSRGWTTLEGRAGLGLTAARDRTWNRVGLGGCAEQHHLLCFEQ